MKEIDLSKEKIIDAEIGELSMEYDKIRGMNVNLARISPDFIDGLKPVQRRTLYIMYLKDGGKKPRKLATISGEVFGKAHPHCLHPATEFVLADGTRKCIAALHQDGKATHDILTWDQKTKKFVIAPMRSIRITKHVDRYIQITLENGGHICCTEDHPILVNEVVNCTISSFLHHSVHEIAQQWVPAGEVDVGNVVYGGELNINQFQANGADGTFHHSHRVVSVEVVQCNNVPMYDYTVDEYGCGAIYIGDPEGLKSNFVIVKNSPTAIEDSVVNIAQEWHNSIPLIEGVGNFGDASGSPAGASRYIQAKLSDYCRACFFEDWKDSVVDMEMAYDEETMMPTYLPAKYPNVMLNGCLGIGYGMSSFMFCCNFRELVEATIMLMKHPEIPIVLIPESPTGAAIVETDFAKLCNSGKGAYTQRCTYEIDDESNRIMITSLPDQVSAVEIREKIADIKEKGGLPELLAMNDLSGKKIQIELIIRDDVNPYRFIRKLINDIPGLEKVYSVSITVINDFNAIDYSVKDLLLQWIQWRREQKRIVVSHKRTRLFAEQRENDVKIFIMDPKRLKRTIEIFTNARDRKETEEALIKEYHNTEIRMDSLQARALSQMYLVELNKNAYEKCLKHREELRVQLEELERELSDPDGVDKLIIGELRDGIKRFGVPRRSSVVPKKIKISTDVEGACILQLSANGTVVRKAATNVEAEPIPTDSNGFAVYIQNDSSFVLINENGYYSFIRAKDIPLDTEVPVARYMKRPLTGRIVAMLPVDMELDYCCVLVSRMGQVKRFKISDMVPSKKPCIALEKGDTIVKGVVVRANSKKDILVYTQNGKGQRLSANDIRITSPSSKGINGFRLGDDEICGIFAINPIDNQYLLYTTIRGKQRLNNIEFLIPRNRKNEQMVSLIPLTDRDKLQSIIAVNKLDQVMVYFKDGNAELLDLSVLPESTMSTPPKKYLKKTVDSLASQVIKVVVK